MGRRNDNMVKTSTFPASEDFKNCEEAVMHEPRPIDAMVAERVDRVRSDSPMRILHIITMDRIRSGGPMQLKRLAVEQVRRGCEVTVVFGKNDAFRDDFRELVAAGVEVRFMEFDGFKASVGTIRIILALRRLIKHGYFDLVHAHKGTTLDLLYFATLGMAVPLIANRGMSAEMAWLRGLKYRSPRVRRIITVSEKVKEVMIQTAGVAAEKANVVYGGVDTDRFHPSVRSSLRNELGIPERCRVIGFLGSLGARKGIAQLLEAFARLRSQHDDLVLVMVGVTDEEMAHRNYVIPESAAAFIYKVSFRCDTPNCLAAFDVFVFPGTRNEGLTGTVREAAAMALPIVTTDVGGNAELIENGKTGLVVPPADIESLRAALEALLANPLLARSLGLAARKMVVKTMTDSLRAERMESIYRQVVSE